MKVNQYQVTEQGKLKIEEELRRIEQDAVRLLTLGCEVHKDLTIDKFEQMGGTKCPICLTERIEMLNHIALSAIALKLNIESGFPPTLHALNRDLALYQARFGGVVEMVGKAAVAMDEGMENESVDHRP
jgi:trimethylamine:corrinoid methyltransferase-like protein